MYNDTIGVVGCGFVGKAIIKGFTTYAEVKSYDIDVKKCSHSLEETVNCDYVFVCLPTPMLKVEGDDADLSIMYDFFGKVSQLKNRNINTLFIIKSTVPVGTVKSLINKFNIVNIVHCPEFLTARASFIDFITPSRIIIGGEDIIPIEIAKKLLTNRFPGVVCHTMNSMESEMVKYMANCFFAVKVSFFNEMKLLINKLNLDWDKILNGVLSDGRIGLSHYQVPGHDGDLGYGGFCFPKDINAMIASMEKNGLEALILRASWELNKKIRKNWDWADSKSSVSS